MALKQIGTRVDESIVEQLDLEVAAIQTAKQLTEKEFNRSKLLATIMSNWAAKVDLNGVVVAIQGENKNVDTENEKLIDENIELKTKLSEFKNSVKDVVPKTAFDTEQQRAKNLADELADVKQALKESQAQTRRALEGSPQNVTLDAADTDLKLKQENDHLKRTIRDMGNAFQSVDGMFKNRSFFDFQAKMIQILSSI